MSSTALETFRTWVVERGDLTDAVNTEQNLAVRQAEMRKDIEHLGAE